MAGDLLDVASGEVTQALAKRPVVLIEGIGEPLRQPPMPTIASRAALSGTSTYLTSFLTFSLVFLLADLLDRCLSRIREPA